KVALLTCPLSGCRHPDTSRRCSGRPRLGPRRLPHFASSWRHALAEIIVTMTSARGLSLTRTQILAHRRQVGLLDERASRGAASLRRAAWAGLQDSMPRAALLSIHARVAGTESSTLADSSLVQLWGPRHHAYVIAARDIALFTLGRLPDEAGPRKVAEDLAARLHALLGGATMKYGEAGRTLGEHNANRLRYAAPTGTVLIRWDGARQPTV